MIILRFINKFDHKILLMKTGNIVRAKTEKKEKRNIFPELKPSLKMVTLNSSFESNVIRNFSKNNNKKLQMSKKGKIKFKNMMDENYSQFGIFKASPKVRNKKSATQNLSIQQITLNKINRSVNSKNSIASNIISYCFDQYQGQRDYNEDRVLLHLNSKILGKVFNFFGVFDGHGGYSTSQFAKNNFINFFEEELVNNPMSSLAENLRKCIEKLQQKIIQNSKTKLMNGGTCASILIITQNQYYIAHLGDSRILSIIPKQHSHQIKQLTTDHKPEEKNQKFRIQANNGKIYRNKVQLNDGSQIIGPYRVLPGRLSVSRTLGDYQAKKQSNGKVIIWEPEIISGKIDQKQLFLIFSDGAYEQFQNNEIAEYFIRGRNFEEPQLRKAIQSYLINSILRESSDNISLMAIVTKQIPL